MLVMSSYKLVVTLALKCQNQTLCLSHTLVLARKQVPVPSLSKENNKNQRTNWIKHRNRGMVGDLGSRDPVPLPWLWVRVSEAAHRVGIQASLLACLPGHAFAPGASCLCSRSEKGFFPQCYPKCSNDFGGRERRDGE